jgi:hypothetical protein
LEARVRKVDFAARNIRTLSRAKEVYAGDALPRIPDCFDLVEGN